MRVSRRLAFEKDYTHVRAYGGREALGMVRSKTVEVVILDLIMPDLNGLEVLERGLKMKPGLMVVIASVIDTSQSALRALRRGATDYFVKPTDPEEYQRELPARVVEQLRLAADPARMSPARAALAALSRKLNDAYQYDITIVTSDGKSQKLTFTAAGGDDVDKAAPGLGGLVRLDRRRGAEDQRTPLRR